MISAKELIKVTNKHIPEDNITKWWELSKISLENMLLERAKLGKCYLFIYQNDLKWLSVPEFREKVRTELEKCGYLVENQSHNGMRIIW